MNSLENEAGLGCLYHLDCHIIHIELQLMEIMAGAISVDSLLNFETIKYFNNEQLETAR